MDPTTTRILKLAASIGLGSLDTVIEPLVHIALLTDPTIADTALVAKVDGNLKHLSRTHLGAAGFITDLAWPFVSPYIDEEITKVIEADKAAETATPAPSEASNG